MNGWMPMLNLAFNDYNMSGENKLLLTMQTKGTVLLVYKQICKVFKSKNEEKMKCVIILATFFALHIHASNELIDYKSQRIVNLYNKAIDYVIADLEISERDMYIDKELGGLCYPRFPRFSNDSIVNVLWEDEYENNGCGIKYIHFKFKRGSNNRKNTKYILVFSQIRHGLFDVEITRIGGYTNVKPIYYPIAPVQGEWHLASYLFECASSFDSFLNVYKFLNYHPKDFTEDVNTKDNFSITIPKTLLKMSTPKTIPHKK